MDCDDKNANIILYNIIKHKMVSGYNKENTSVHLMNFHFVWSPRYRRKLFSGKLRERLIELIREKSDELNCKILQLEVMPDHIHLLIDINPLIGVHTIIQRIKGYTANVLRKKYSSLRSRLPSLWTRSKFVSTVGEVSLETVKKYIEEQKGK